MTNKKMALMVGAAALLSACATTRTASAEERAQCELMAQQMGIGTSHDHGSMKGAPRNSMNLSHERCQRMLAEK